MKSFRNKHSVYVDFLTRFWDHSHTFSQYILQELNWLLSKQKSSPSMQFEMQDVEIHVLQPLLLVYWAIAVIAGINQAKEDA